MIGEGGLGIGLGEERGARGASIGHSHSPISVAIRATLPNVLLVCDDPGRHSGGLFRASRGINLNKQGSEATHKLDTTDIESRSTWWSARVLVGGLTGASFFLEFLTCTNNK